MTPCETIYVSNLPGDVHYSEIKNCFEQFGRIDDIDIKRRSEITFAFVRYSTTR
ncbi:MAG: Serine/arginine-rich splicing factor 1 [Marteilia pararefringens]